ncbi:hypothetical protein AB0M28_12830 [Streptomyces sp. NPDC051940]|uniref:hypothetical protein n=1 Tax=Streptomyces sp. NPDC051940 TaxID=3155675 RepID=UPI00341F672A
MTARLRRAAAVALLAAALAGCGIRPTSVPVDAGSAPTRARCGGENPPTPGATPREGAQLMDVYFVCGAKIAPVRRNMERAQGVPAAQARQTLKQELLDALRDGPGAKESLDGYSTGVDDIALVRARTGDPAAAVRFDRDPEQLTRTALAQLVCTYAGLGDGREAVLGTAHRLREYACTDEVRENPSRVLNGVRDFEG